jgi:hypothetical protein
MPRKRKSTKKRVQRVSVRAERREQVDWDKFAWALIQHVRVQQQAARKEQRRDD